LDYPRRTPQAPEVKQKWWITASFWIQGFPTIYFANGTDAWEVNFEGLGNTGYVAGGPVAWLYLQIKFLKK
jgi:protein disulfide-isomerase